MMFSLFERVFGGSRQSERITTAVIGLSLAAVGTSIYLSPVSGHPGGRPKAQVVTPAVSPRANVPSARASETSTAPTKRPAKPSPEPDRTKPHPSPPGYQVIHAPGKTDVVVKERANPVTTINSGAAAIPHCADFSWQQDAQTSYIANLSDPGSLDGATGPHNGDGIACNNLPVDPNRAQSIPIDAYVPPIPSAAAKSELVSPNSKYFGVAQDGLPGDSVMFDRLAKQTGKAPSSVEWFSGFDSNYPTDQVVQAWSRGSLPIITWMSVAADPGSGHDSSEYTLTHVVSGDLDDYLYQYAGDVVRANLPVAIRFDHEMNNNAYPWSAGAYGNTPAKYIAAWRHIWNIFNKVGANTNAIWMWAPTRIDNLKPGATSGSGVGQTTLAEDYPGDGYVDWLGASIYLRQAKTGTGYDATFGKTIAALKKVSSKPIFLSETAAAQSDVSTRADLTAEKSAWISNALAGFLADPRIVGFVWFNNRGIQTVDGEQVANDWRFDSSAAALAAFKRGISDSRFASGTLRDGA
ncbi:MAG TPA: glycosyl hydrolase [Jatrophihabitans sp.]|jgi:hypothetical protein